MPDPATLRIQSLVAGLTNYERTRPNAIRWSLETMQRLLERPGARLPSGKLVQVGGSKGKGTVAAYLESLGEACRLTTGSYFSPHVETVLERVRLSGRNVELAELVRVLEPILAFVRGVGLQATFFEVMTAAAVQLFAERAVALGILEVGLGGRLDATTAVPVQAAILTNVELEHTQLLGDTVEKIAAEKAYIARPGALLVTSVTGSALAVVQAHCSRIGAELLVQGRDWELADLVDHGDRFCGVIRDASSRRQSFTLLGATRVEVSAFALAFTTLRRLWPELEINSDPAPRPRLPGRFEVVGLPGGGTLVLDGAHTERSLEELATELARRYPGRRFAVLFASAIDKRWQGGLRSLLPFAEIVVSTRLSDTPCVEPDEIVTWCKAHGVRAESAADPGLGLSRLQRWSDLQLVTGSFYLVGAVKGCVGTSATS